jgi:hypothetical protein
VQIVAVAHEDVVRLLVNLDVQVARRSSPGPDLALSGEPDSHAVADAGGDLHGDLAPSPHPSVAAALVARVEDDFAHAAAGRARSRGHDLTEQRALHGLHLAAPTAGVAGRRRRILVGAAALAAVTQHRGVNGDLLADAGRAFGEVQPHPQQRIRTRLDPPDRSAGGRAATEERLEHIAQTTEATESVRGRPRVRQRVATQVDDASLLRVGQHLVGDADLLEFGLGDLVGVDVGVQLTRQLAISAFDLRIARVLAHAEQPVIVACHA